MLIPIPQDRLALLEKAAIYQTVTVPAVYNKVTVPATEETPESEETVLVSPEKEEQELVTPAIYRDETDEEFLTRVALKDVPFGQPYKIVDVEDIPTDRSTRAAWTVDEAELTDGHGADWGEGSDTVVTEWAEDGTPKLATVIVDSEGNHTLKEVV